MVEGLQSAIGDITEAENQQRGYLLTSDASYLSAYDAALIRVREGFNRLLKLTSADRPLNSHIVELRGLTDRRLEVLASGVHYYRTGDERRAREMIDLGRPLSTAIRAHFGQLQPEYERALAQARTLVPELRRAAVRSFVITSAIAAVVLAFMAALIILETRFVRALSERLLHASRHDELTQLPNRAYLNEWLARSIASAKRANEKLGLLYMDLNGFKQVNDNLGHQAGDSVLVEVSRELERIARDSDFIARLGGDEFAVITPRITDRRQVEAAVQRFAALQVTRGALRVGASVGSAVYPDDAESAEALLKVGDAAMYERKQASKRA